MKEYTVEVFTNMPLDELLHEASRMRNEQSGNEIEFCAIVNAKSGRCAMDCRFCAQSVHHGTNVESYPLLDADALVSETQKRWNRGIHRIGWVTSGCSATDDEITQIADAALRCRGGRLCVSLGQLDENALRRLKEAGVTRYHHNLETSEAFDPSVCSTQKWSDRLATVRRAKKIGLEVCSGGLFGLGESWQDRYDLAMVLQEIGVDSVPINFLNPIPGTPLAGRPRLSVEEGLRILAMYRILLTKATIRICGGRPTTFGDRQSEILRSGVNAIMTGDYLTTGGISPENDLRMIQENGFRTSGALGAANHFTQEELKEALRAIESTISKCEKVQPKLKSGTSQLTLLRRRIEAFRIAVALIERELNSNTTPSESADHAVAGTKVCPSSHAET